MIPTQKGSVHLYTKFQVDSLFVQNRRSQNFETGSCDSGQAYLGVVLCYLRRRVRPPSLYQT